MKIKKEYSKDLHRETKKRIAKTLKEFSKEPDLKVFENKEGYNQMIAQVRIPCSAKCEHHHLEFKGFVSIAYIPGQWIFGLSKLARIAEYYMNPTRYTLQERITKQIADHIDKALKPGGIMVVVKAKHSCISDRGVKKPSLTITSDVRGIFSHDLGARSEFLQLVNSGDN